MVCDPDTGSVHFVERVSCCTMHGIFKLACNYCMPSLNATPPLHSQNARAHVISRCEVYRQVTVRTFAIFYEEKTYDHENINKSKYFRRSGAILSKVSRFFYLAWMRDLLRRWEAPFVPCTNAQMNDWKLTTTKKNTTPNIHDRKGMAERFSSRKVASIRPNTYGSQIVDTPFPSLNLWGGYQDTKITRLWQFVLICLHKYKETYKRN